jgi:hypothetical protein
MHKLFVHWKPCDSGGFSETIPVHIVGLQGLQGGNPSRLAIPVGQKMTDALECLGFLPQIRHSVCFNSDNEDNLCFSIRTLGPFWGFDVVTDTKFPTHSRQNPSFPNPILEKCTAIIRRLKGSLDGLDPDIEGTNASTVRRGKSAGCLTWILTCTDYVPVRKGEQGCFICNTGWVRVSKGEAKVENT